MHQPFLGLVPAVLTPFHRDGSLNLLAVEQQADLLLRDGINAVFVGGTTGEFSSLTLDERLALADRWADVLEGTPARLVVHVGANCLEESRRLARHAEARRAAAVAMLSPSYARPRSADVLVECCREVAREAPSTPFYYYDIPSMTGVTFNVADWIDAAAERIPNLAGVKFTNPDMMTFQRLLRAGGGRFDVLFGMDEQLLAAFALGGRGAVGSGYNFAAPQFHRLLAAAARGDLDAARAEQFRAVTLIELMFRLGYLACAKELVLLRGVDLGPVRLPHSNFTPDQSALLHRELELLGGGQSVWGRDRSA
jgi:N-acetylneuraminate lyase